MNKFSSDQRRIFVDNPFFSVVIPTFNRAQTIRRAIDSVLNQSFKDFELIVVDDGSTDLTSEILESYENLKVIKQKNKGVSAARNTGIRAAKGQWIALLDSDDEWLNDKLAKQFDYINQNSERIVHGNEIWIRDNLEVKQHKKHRKGGGDQFERCLELCLIAPSCVVFQKSLFIEKGPFREDFEVCEDYDLWLKISFSEKIGFIDDPLVKKYAGHDDQLSVKFFAMDLWRVKSLSWILDHYDLSELLREKVAAVFNKKCEILIKGFIKHRQKEKLLEVTELKAKYV